MRYVFHPEALSEYAEAVQYYTEQRVEVSQAFINAIWGEYPESFLIISS
jgi:toxin ParE1/3/4